LRYFIRLSYLGKAYHGWQKQPNALTVQQVFEEALGTLLRQETNVVAAGRTDTGVHAKEMFVHFDADVVVASENLCYRLNAFLPSDVAVQELYMVKDDAHARFDALERTYTYHVVRHKDPFYHESAHQVTHPLDVDAMNMAAHKLLGYDDFECFSKSNTDVKTFICDVKHAEWKRIGDLLVFTITADRFLRNMVRAIVGTLLDVGSGKMSVAGIDAVIKSKDRSKAGVSVPAKGLYLTKIKYPEAIFL